MAEMFPALVADVGGSNARFGWVAHAQAPIDLLRVLPVADHASLAHAARAYLDEVSRSLGGAACQPRSAALAVATAVQGDEVAFTNSSWSFSVESLRRGLGLAALRVLNDFEALALALPALAPTQYRAWGAAPRAEGCLAVVGAGTGLGVAGVIQAGPTWHALPGEGGHATLAAGNDLESELLRLVRQDYRHVSAERLLSGIGLPVLHQALLRLHGEPSGAALGDGLTTAMLVQQAVAGDPVCRRTMLQFCAFLGSFAGNVALTLGARGGLFVAGGIVPRLGDLFFESTFRERFEAKGRFEAYLQAIPCAVLTDTLAALQGARRALPAA